MFLAILTDKSNHISYYGLSCDREQAVCQAREKFTDYTRLFFPSPELPQTTLQVVYVSVETEMGDPL